MRVLLDEQMPRDLVSELVGHDVRTVGQLGWKGMQNGELLAAAAARFDALITMDKRFALDSDLAPFAISVLLIRASSNRIEALRPLVPAIIAALDRAQAGVVRRIGA